MSAHVVAKAVDGEADDARYVEFVEAVHVPVPDAASRFAVWKISKRRDEDITAVLGAFDIRITDGRVEAARIAYGGMAATPKRALVVKLLHAEAPGGSIILW